MGPSSPAVQCIAQWILNNSFYTFSLYNICLVVLHFPAVPVWDIIVAALMTRFRVIQDTDIKTCGTGAAEAGQRRGEKEIYDFGGNQIKQQFNFTANCGSAHTSVSCGRGGQEPPQAGPQTRCQTLDTGGQKLLLIWKHKIYMTGGQLPQPAWKRTLCLGCGKLTFS